MTPDEIIHQRMGASWTELGLVALSTLLIFGAVIVATRLSGLRSFSKMSAFDFAMTVAVGSLLATIAVTTTSLPAGLVALGALFGLQTAIAGLRRRSERFAAAVDNTPMLLMVEGRFLHGNLRRSRMTEDDVRAKLREANVLGYGQVRAVVLETTGDVSVLHGDEAVDPDLLRNVQGVESLP